MTEIQVRPVRQEDVPALFKMMQALAAFEGLSEQVCTSQEALAEALFSESPKAYAHLILVEQMPAGYGMLVPLPYIKRGQSKLVLEDFYVDGNYRGQGLGKTLMDAMTNFAKEHGYFKIEWRVLSDNAGARRFYEQLDAEPITDWISYQLPL